MGRSPPEANHSWCDIGNPWLSRISLFPHIPPPVKCSPRGLADKEKGQRFKIWETENVLPLEVSELSAHFRQIVGWKETLRRLGHSEHQPTSSTGSIELTDEFMYPDGKSSTDGMMEHMRGMLSGRSGEIWSGGRGEGHEGKADRNCILIDEGSDVEAEQEEEEVDSIANDLEVW